ncbi:MAG: hypothetical protein DDT34_00978 [Firmicutes bacterium]|nr:hypothetical protein [Bacillota bacterium]
MSERPVPVTVRPSRVAKISDGKSVVVIVPTAMLIEAGRFYVIEGHFGAAFFTVPTTAPAGTLTTLNLEQAEYTIATPQLAAVTFVRGQLVYWTPGNLLTNVATGNRLVGRCTVGGVGPAGPIQFALSDAATSLLTQATAQANSAAAPTQAEFNALLDRLRVAGVIAT